MKKLIPFITTIAMILFSMGAVLAPEPCPFLFEVLTSPPDITGLTLEMTYVDAWGNVIGTWGLQEQVPGEYSIDLGHVGIPSCLTQNFGLVIKECEGSSVCHQTVSFNVGPGPTVLDVRSANLFITTTVTTTTPVTTTIPTTTIKECFTSAECHELVDCVKVCETWGWKKDCPFTVDEEIYQIISGISIIINIILGLKVGVGIKATYFKSKSGKTYVGVKSHRHANAEHYHSIYTIHKKEPHKKGEVNPSYDAYGKYLGGG